MIKPGDQAKVIDSIDGASVGSIVTVMAFQGEHSKYGRILRCRSKSTIVTEFGGIGNEADFAEDWLQKIDDPDIVEEDSLTLEQDA